MSPKTFIAIAFTILAFMILSLPAAAQEKPIQISLFNPVQIFSEDYSIAGVRLNLIYGKNTRVSGLDLGLVNHTTSGLSKGVQLGFVGLVDEDFVGLQGNDINIVKNHFEGFQWGIVNYAKSASGFQLGIVNYAGTMRGLQIGLVNIIKKDGMFPVFPIINWSF